MVRRTARKRTPIAAAVALLAHLGALWVIGWRSPGLNTVVPADDNRAMQVQLVRPFQRAAAPASDRPSAQPHAQGPARSAPAFGPAPETTVIPPNTQQAAGGGAGDCAPEDLPLLTEAERQHCRNQIDAENGRRAARGADERLAKRLATLSTASAVDSMPAEKRAYYDAVAAAYAGPGHLPGLACPFVKLKKPPPGSVKVGPCYITPPQGVLTEELGLDPP
jgi:hypothetical protein